MIFRKINPRIRFLDQLGQSLAVVAECLNSAEFDREKCLAAASSFLLATDLADYLVEAGVPFRQASFGGAVGFLAEKNLSLPNLSDEDVSEVSEHLTGDWREVFNLERAFAKREKPGMPGPNQIDSRIRFWENLLDS